MEKKVYESCDKAIKILNRKSMKEFNSLKLADFDNLNVIRTVRKMYRKLAKQAEQEYRKVAYDAYMYGMWLCWLEWEERREKAEKMAEKAITKEWVREILEQTDFVTLYRFDSETERKADRLIEAIAVVEGSDERGAALRSMRFNRNDQIDGALRAWSKQVGQYAINVTDYAVLKAFKDAGVEEAEWVTETDHRVCSYCHSMSGKRYKVDEFPSKPHINCRCTAKPVLK